MRKLFAILIAAMAVLGVGFGGTALADGPSGSTECHLADDDCDGSIDEDTTVDGTDQDGDGADGEDPEGDATDEDGENQVSCAEGEQTPGTPVDESGLTVFAGESGIEVCNDADGPVQGRVILSADGYVAADGDADNVFEGDDTLTGYARVDDGGLRCGDDNNQDSTAADQSENTADDCGSEGGPPAPPV